jgi:membrane associated rhomboid family serine protease
MITIIIIVITSLISIRAFKDSELMSRLIFHPPAVKQGNGYRLFTYGVVHADYTHLIFNMFTLYFFGPNIERTFKSVLGQTSGSAFFILLYLSALLVSIIPTYFKKKDNASYFYFTKLILANNIYLYQPAVVGVLFVYASCRGQPLFV